MPWSRHDNQHNIGGIGVDRTQLVLPNEGPRRWPLRPSSVDRSLNFIENSNIQLHELYSLMNLSAGVTTIPYPQRPGCCVASKACILRRADVPLPATTALCTSACHHAACMRAWSRTRISGPMVATLELFCIHKNDSIM